MGLEIVAALAISLSEIQTVDSSITEEWIREHPTKFKMILYHLGMDVENPIEQQDCTHRNSRLSCRYAHKAPVYRASSRRAGKRT